MALEEGQIVEGKYRVTKLLGEGGMGAVYECENTAIQKRFAIKVLHASVADNKDAVGRFEKEAQAAGRIGSDHITEVVDLGTLSSGDRFMVMEYLDGCTLSERIKERGKLSPSEVAPIMVQLLEGLQAAHKAQIIHRDLKPDNVFLLRSKAGIKDFVKILDFGISKFNKLSGDAAMSMTRTGAVMGTPYYMSPEQAKGSKEIDARSDLYSVGVILYEAVTGQVPFNADTFNELLFKIVLEAPPPPEQIVPDLDPAFSSIIRKAMTRNPEHRFETATEFQQTMLQWMQGGGVKLFEDSTTSASTRAAMGSLHVDAPAAHAPALATTDTSLAAPPRRNTGVMVGAAVAAVALLGIGGLAVSKMGDKPAAPVATSGLAPTTPPASAEPAATTTATAAATAVPSVAVVPAAASSSAPVAAADKAPEKPVAPEKKSVAVGGPAIANPPGAAPATLPANPPAGSKPAAGTAGGRKIRTGLD